MSLSIISLKLLVVFGTVSSVFAQQAPDLEPPKYKIGDSWTWAVTVNPRDACTTNVLAGAKATQVVDAMTDTGYSVAVSGPGTGVNFKRTYSKDLTFSGSAGGVPVKSNLLNFPLKAGNTWDTSIGNGNVLQTLSCKSAEFESLKVGGEELQVMPIVCTGRWKNLSSNNTDRSTFKYWYSPKVGNFARQTVFTYFQGGTCVDVDWRLESYKVSD